MRMHADYWNEILEWSVKQNEKLEFLSIHQDILQFNIQEDGFWNFYAPNIERALLDWESMSDRSTLKKLSRTSSTPLELESDKENPPGLNYWIKSKAELEYWEEKGYTYTSLVTRDLLDYCDMFEKCDPLLDANVASNYWTGSTSINDVESPSVARIRIWVNDLFELLIDPVGFDLLRTMVPKQNEKEFIKRVETIMKSGVGKIPSDLFMKEASERSGIGLWM
jgi:hypothetical protein